MNELLNITETTNNQNDIASRFDCQVMLPYYDQDGITIYNADCRTAMRALRPSWIVTDPPYGINYDGAKYKKWSGQELGWNKIQNDDGSLDLEFIFRAEGNKVVFGADNYLDKIEYKGSWIIWDKRVDEKNDKMFGNPIEMAWNSKEGLHKIYRIKHGGVVNADSIYGNNEKRFHPTQKPVRLFYRILEDFTNEDDLILDPFMGSGTTLIAAQKLGRKAIGIEIDKYYCDIAIKRLAQMEMF
jgi:DNA modification methylase